MTQTLLPSGPDQPEFPPVPFVLTSAQIVSALGYTPMVNTSAAINSALGYTPLANTSSAIDSALGYTPLANTGSAVNTALGYTPLANTAAAIDTALGFTPVQQGTGINQLSNVVKIGWSPSASVKVTIDTTDEGYIPFSSTAAGTFTYSGAIVASGNVTAYSDERLKKDWAPLADAFIPRLAAVKMGSFTRTDIGGRYVGV
ncbi:MAG: hypothetical protein ACREQ5_39970, partial [Candidatus Dormibacteria bacterium]